MITDDHGVVRQGLRMFLSRDPGPEVVGEAANGEEAVTMARELEPDVVLMDLLMPVMNGIEATEALTILRGSGSEAPFIVVSGKVGDDVAVEMMKAGAHDYVMKDNLARLCTTVERGLEEVRERRRAEKELGRRDAILEAVRFAAERFLSKAAGWEESIEDVLERLGAATGVSRVYIFENYVGEDGELWATYRYEWVAPGVSVQLDSPSMVALPFRAAGYGRWAELWSRGEIVYGHTREFPEIEQTELKAQDILSVVVVPIFVKGRWWGRIGFDECFAEREWSAAEMDALKAAASTLGAAIQRRRIEEELRGSEERYRAILDNATAVVYVKDKEGRYLLTNRRYEELFHVSREQVMGKTDHDLFSKEAADEFRANDERVLRLGTPLELEEAAPQDDGLHTYISVKFPLRGPDGVTYALCGISTDITERKRAEAELTREREFLTAMLDSLKEGIVACNAGGDLTLFNRATREFHGIPEEEIGPDEWAERYDLYRADGYTPMRKEEIPLFRAYSGENVRDAEMVIAPKGGPARTLVANGQAASSAR